jgi:hypothetical protein
MNHTTLNAGSAMNQCARFTALLVSSLRAQAFIQQISSYQHLWIKCADYLTKRSRHADHLLKLDRPSTLLARALEGLTQRLKGASLWVAKVLVGALCLSGTQPAEAQLDAIKLIKSLAAYQLTDAQYLCHNSIIYIESRWKIDAVGNKTGNKQTHGYYQMKSKAAINAPYDKQFELYWYYVAKRYGVTKYDEPDYCAALKHLRTRGWQ